MKFTNKINAAITMLRVKLLKKRVPLAVRWQLTNRCFSRCIYCNTWTMNDDRELSTAKILTIIDGLRKCGTQTISFSGGEPLMRDDIGTILAYCRKKGISTSMNSNGGLVVKKIEQIVPLDLLKLSLDGPEAIHDFMADRKGSYQQVLEAIKTAQSKGIKTIFTATLTKYNIAHCESILEIAQRFHTLVAFQPLKRFCRSVPHLETIMPAEEEYKKVIARLIALKKKGNKNMRNSVGELKYIYYWPKYNKIKCWAGRIFCMIGVKGELYLCDRIQPAADMPNCVALGFGNAFRSLPLTLNCEGCGFCGTLELNLLMAFRFGILKTIRKIVD